MQERAGQKGRKIFIRRFTGFSQILKRETNHEWLELPRIRNDDKLAARERKKRQSYLFLTGLDDFTGFGFIKDANIQIANECGVGILACN